MTESSRVEAQNSNEIELEKQRQEEEEEEKNSQIKYRSWWMKISDELFKFRDFFHHISKLNLGKCLF